jgi:hypothetical protein
MGARSLWENNHEGEYKYEESKVRQVDVSGETLSAIWLSMAQMLQTDRHR